MFCHMSSWQCKIFDSCNLHSALDCNYRLERLEYVHVSVCTVHTYSTNLQICNRSDATSYKSSEQKLFQVFEPEPRIFDLSFIDQRIRPYVI